MIKKCLSIVILFLCALILPDPIIWAEIPLQHSDGEILGLSFIIEEDEVQEAYLAMQKNINKEVLEYAKALYQEIGARLNAIIDFSQKTGIKIIKNTPSDNQVLKKDGKDMAALNTLDGTAFAQLYLTVTIKKHTEVLNWIDNQQAQTDEVKGYLKEARKNVSKNLDTAILILKHQTANQL